MRGIHRKDRKCLLKKKAALSNNFEDPKSVSAKQFLRVRWRGRGGGVIVVMKKLCVLVLDTSLAIGNSSRLSCLVGVFAKFVVVNLYS